LTVNTVPWPDIPSSKGASPSSYSSSSSSSESNQVYPHHSSATYSTSSSFDNSRKNSRFNTIDVTDSSSTPVTLDSNKRTTQSSPQGWLPPEAGAGSPITSFYNNPRYSFQGSAPNVIRFISPQIEYSRFSKFKSSSLIIRRDSDLFNPESGAVLVKKGELAVVLFVLSGWMLIIFIFVKKWGKIRGIETVSTYQGVPVTVHTGSGISPSATTFATAGVGGFPAEPSAHNVRGSISSAGGGGLRSQKSKESDESSGVNEGASLVGNKASSQPETVSSVTPVPIPGVVCSSIKKKRLEDAMHQFLLLKNQQAIASGGHGILGGSGHYYGHWNGGYGFSLHSNTSSTSRNYYYCDQFMVGRKGVRSQENPRVSISAASNCERPVITRRGSLEGASSRKIVRSESHLKLLRDSSRMNRSAENLLLDFPDEDAI
jgi:hypothetical protein